MFANKSYLLLLLLIPVIVLLLSFFYEKRKRAVAIFVSESRISELSNVSFRAYKLKNLFFVLALIFLIIAVARPRWGEKREEVIKESSEVVLALDVSNSMLAKDITPCRLEAAKALLSTVISDNEGEKIGIITFAGNAMWACPMTYDVDALKSFLSGAQAGSMPIGGTQLSSVVNLAAKALSAGAQNAKLMILISDGEDHDSAIGGAVKNAKDSGLKIITAAVGTQQGAPVPFKDEFGNVSGYIKDGSGKIVMSRANTELLRKIAAETGGQFLELSGGSVTRELSKAIKEAKKSKFGTTENSNKKERFQIFLIAAIIAFLISFAIRTGLVIKNE
ncbi:MAG: VWA domain-containing protein [Endomicrobia bacterium]|nr:VWA domain-containing protein [Endomicrobiia bacterium]